MRGDISYLLILVELLIITVLFKLSYNSIYLDENSTTDSYGLAIASVDKRTDKRSHVLRRYTKYRSKSFKFVSI